MQENYSQRNREVIRLCHAGASAKEVARQFRITTNRVRQILARNTLEREVARRANRLAETIRLADDPERTWAVMDLLDALLLPTPTRNALTLHWARNAVTRNRMSLRQLMDLVVAPTSESRDYLIIPVFLIRGVGGFGLRALLNGMKRLNLNGVCGEEWRSRFDLESALWRIQGGENYFWSMPNPMRRSPRP